MEQKSGRFEYLRTDLTFVKFERLELENDLEYSGNFHSEINDEDKSDARVVGSVKMRDIETKDSFIEVKMIGYFKLFDALVDTKFDLKSEYGQEMVNIVFSDISSLIADLTRKSYARPILLPNEISKRMIRDIEQADQN